MATDYSGNHADIYGPERRMPDQIAPEISHRLHLIANANAGDLMSQFPYTPREKAALCETAAYSAGLNLLQALVRAGELSPRLDCMKVLSELQGEPQ